MRRLIALLFLIFTLSGVAVAQQMSDDQVIQYVKSSQQMGKTQKQITTELMRRGVTKEQVERIQQKYEGSKSGNQQNNTQSQSRQRGQQNADKKSDANSINQRNNIQQRSVKGLRTINGRQMYRGDQVKLTLGEIRSIQVNIMGEVGIPGNYTLSSFASVFHALYRAGGVNKIGSLRSIKVVRNGNVIADLDVYDFIMKSKMKDVVRLQDGDVILVDPYQSLVQILGKVKRPMFYEMKSTETIATLLKYAGSFTGDAYKKAICVIRKSGRERDVLYIPSIHDLKEESTLTIHGEVANPGTYLYSDNMTVEDLILQAGGLLEAAATTKIEIARRVKEPKSTTFSTTVGKNFSFDLKDGLLLVNGTVLRLKSGNTKANYTEAQKKYANFVDANQNIILLSYRAEQERLQDEMNLAYISIYTSISTVADV